MINIVDLPLAEIAPVGDRETQGNRMYRTIYLLLEEDVDYASLTNNDITISAAARTCASLPLKDGATGWVPFSFVKKTAGFTSEGSEGDITSEITNTLSGTIGGRRIVLDNFLECNMGKAFLAVTMDAITGKKYLHGRPYAPLTLSSFTKRVNSENCSADITFTQNNLMQELEYLGEVVSADGD